MAFDAGYGKYIGSFKFAHDGDGNLALAATVGKKVSTSQAELDFLVFEIEGNYETTGTSVSVNTFDLSDLEALVATQGYDI